MTMATMNNKNTIHSARLATAHKNINQALTKLAATAGKACPTDWLKTIKYRPGVAIARYVLPFERVQRHCVNRIDY